ncbi:ergothioneine biosynthesis protein EgtB [Aquincola sp. MAHUQ-54]|uniref:Ergothioneine biosynthesis protein EgtB n=1 Tax=Aquincola agrisoli TaxID=3119538 RepID=A0AAW9QCM7_9BURK
MGATAAAVPAAAELARRYAAVRRHSLALAEPLSPEDQCVQSMPDASPTKWHLAHTTWFFETLVLQPDAPGYRPVDPRYGYLFNSYYEALGPRHPRPQRGLLTRPTQAEVLRYRQAVDEAMLAFLPHAGPGALQAVELGLHHEQQHQELMLTDLKHLLSANPLHPAYLPAPPAAARPAAPQASALRWLAFDGARADIGHPVHDGFAFDNEGPRHAVLLHPFELASRPVSCGEYLQFVRDGGYRDPRWWLSDGWAAAQTAGWLAPPGWHEVETAQPQVFTLFGLQPLQPAEPVCHLSFYEAAAYAAWAGARLPTEFEWEHAMRHAGAVLRRTGGGDLHPHPRAPGAAGDAGAFEGLHEVWEWTRSAYDPYPGFRPLGGAASEYNGKFMVGQLVLRGASCATPPGHARLSYRNFFPPAARWQFSGLRLARDLG